MMSMIRGFPLKSVLRTTWTRRRRTGELKYGSGSFMRVCRAATDCADASSVNPPRFIDAVRKKTSSPFVPTERQVDSCRLPSREVMELHATLVSVPPFQQSVVAVRCDERAEGSIAFHPELR